jgi:voltage-gated potassium channel
VGYGDIIPVAPVARMVAVLEAIAGQIFLTTFLAFLVGNYLAQRQDDRQRLSGM